MKTLLILMCFILSSPCWAATYTCGTNGVDDSCTIAGLNTLIGNASDGDTINIATGTHNLDPSGSSYILVNKRVTISGQGYCGSSANDDPGADCGDIQAPSGTWPVTIDVGSNSEGSGLLYIRVTSAGSENVRVTGIDFTGGMYAPGVLYTNYCSGWGGAYTSFVHEDRYNIAAYRIDNNRFRQTNANYLALDVGVCSDAYGLIDHNYFYNTSQGKSLWIERNAIYDSIVENYSNNGGCTPNCGGGQGPAKSWENPIDFGTANFVFIEDNSINRPTCGSMGPMYLDSVNGARFVFRYNYVYNSFGEFHGFSGGSYSTPGYAVEWYNNFITNTSNCYNAFWFRGGTGLVHNNTIYGTYSAGATPPYPGIFRTGDSQGRPSGNYGAFGSAWDGNCHDGGAASNTYVSKANGFNYDCGEAGNPYPIGYPTFGQPGWGQVQQSVMSSALQPQVRTPIRVWSNSIYSGSAVHGLTINDSAYVSLNRDYFYSTDASAALIGYTPYTYPHPLQAGGVVPSSTTGGSLQGGSVQ